MYLIWQIGLSVLSGVLLGLAFPPWNVSWLVWIAFVPVLNGLLILRGSALVMIVGLLAEEHQGEAPLLAVAAPDFLEAEPLAEEAQGRRKVADADHRVQVAHGG